MGCWHGYPSGTRCRLAYGPADATATDSLASVKIQIGFTFLVLAYLGSPKKGAVKRVYVCVCVEGTDKVHVTTEENSSVSSLSVMHYTVSQKDPQLFVVTRVCTCGF